MTEMCRDLTLKHSSITLIGSKCKLQSLSHWLISIRYLIDSKQGYQFLPHFSLEPLDSDFSIVKLKKAIIYSEKTRPLGLPKDTTGKPLDAFDGETNFTVGKKSFS